MRRLFILGAACHQITYIVVESWLFAGVRERAARISAHAGKLVSCHLCFGTWVGMALAALFRPGLVPPAPAAPARGLLAWAVDAFTIALVGRALNELLAIARREVERRRSEARLLGELAEEVSQREGEASGPGALVVPGPVDDPEAHARPARAEDPR